MGLRHLSGLCALVGTMAPIAAAAQPAIRLDRQMFVERVTTDINGRARRILASADRLAPGDQLIFVVHWSNAGRTPLRALSVTNPVRRDVQPDLSDPAMLVSVDGGAHWGRLDRLWLPTPLGGTRRAVPSDVTHIRWTVTQPISPGDSGRLSYRATVR